MKHRVLLPFFLVAVLILCFGVSVHQHRAFSEHDERLKARSYLEQLEASLEDAETVPMEMDEQTGRVIGVHADSPSMVKRVNAYLANAAEVRRVKSIPVLAYPLVYLGDRMTGNNQALYYSDNGTITEFSLDETDQLAFLLYLSGTGTMYPEVKAAFPEGVIRQLRDQIVFGDQDVITYKDGNWASIDIKTPETVQMLFHCIQHCVQISDLTDADLEPMALPIEINGQGTGTFETFFVTYEETGQFLSIAFSPEDAQCFRNYATTLQP